MSEELSIPKHLGIIMDGNRRWAEARHAPSLRGHAKGQQVLRTVARHAFKRGVTYLTVYAFSTENWKRDPKEVNYLMRRVSLALKKYLHEFVEDGVRILFLGQRENLPPSVVRAIENAEAATAHNTAGTFGICLNYGGQQEIVDAVKQMMASGTPIEAATPRALAKF